MDSDYQKFWEYKSFAVIGNSKNRPFPKFTLAGLLNSGKTAYPVDPAVDNIEGTAAFSSLSELPGPVEAAVIEVQKEETLAGVEAVVTSGIKNLWIHMGTETPEAIKAANDAGLNLCYGTCAVMYVNNSGIHKFHGWINKLFKKY